MISCFMYHNDARARNREREREKNKRIVFLIGGTLNEYYEMRKTQTIEISISFHAYSLTETT